MPDQITVRVEVGAYVLHGREVAHVEVQQAVGTHTQCVLTFDRDSASTSSPVASLRLPDLADAPVRVVLVAGGGTECLAFAGRVRDAELAQQPGGTGGWVGRFTVHALSDSHVLSEHADRRYFPEHDVAAVAGALGVRVQGSLPATPREYVQPGVPAWTFLAQVAAEEGLQLRSRWPRTPGDAADQPAELAKGFSDTTHALMWGRELQQFTAVLSPRNAGVTGAFYEPASKHDHQYRGVRADVSWLGGARPVVAAAERVTTRDADGGDPGHLEPGRVAGVRARTHSEFRDRLELASARRAGAAVTAHGTSTLPAVRAGDRIQVLPYAAGLFSSMTDTSAMDDTAGTYGLIKVSHHWSGSLYENTFTATPWADYHPEPAHAAVDNPGGVPGLTLGVVVDVDDPEHHGRVRVRHTWMEDAEKTTWVRVAGLGGGNGRGVAALPSKGDEVVLGALDGDPEHLVVLAGLWNGVDKAAHGPGRQHWVTRAGHTVAFIDGGKDTHDDRVELYTPAGKAWVQLTAKGPQGVPLVTVYSEGDLSLEAPKGTLRLSAKQMLTTVEGDAKRHVKGAVVEKVDQAFTMTTGQQFEVGAGTHVLVSAHGSAAVTSSSQLTLLAPIIKENPPLTPVPAIAAAVPNAPATAYKKPAVPAPGPGTSTHDPKTPTKQEQAAGASASTAAAGNGAGGNAATAQFASYAPVAAAAPAAVVGAAAVGAALPCTAAQNAAALAERRQAAAEAQAQVAAMPPGPERDAMQAAATRYADDTRALGRAGLARHVYFADEENPPELPAGYRQLRGEESLGAYGLRPDDMSPPNSKFRAALYIDETDGRNTPVLAFKGTEFTSLEDWKNNGQQALGLESDFYERAIAVGASVSDATGGKFETTGHSLGGGMASAVSATYKVRGDTFNAAGVSEITLRRHKTARADGADLLNAYQIQGEILTGLQRRDVQRAILAGVPSLFGPAGRVLGMGLSTAREILGDRVLPAALGYARTIAAVDPTKYQGWYQALNPMRAVNRHGMESVINSMKKEMGADARALGNTDPRC